MSNRVRLRARFSIGLVRSVPSGGRAVAQSPRAPSMTRFSRGNTLRV